MCLFKCIYVLIKFKIKVKYCVKKGYDNKGIGFYKFVVYF